MARGNKLSQDDIEQMIVRKLAESGERERLRALLLNRMEDTGWGDDGKGKVNSIFH